MPRSLGGSDDPSNIVRLTCREHYFAHLLLQKIFGGPMSIALWRMSNARGSAQRYKKITSWHYEKARHGFCLELSERFKGVKRPDWVVDKISKALKGRVIDEKWRKAMSDAQKGMKRGPMSEEQKDVLRNYYKGRDHPNKGRTTSDLQKKATSEAHRGRNSHRYNHNVFTFRHKDGTVEVCTQHELRKKYGVPHGNLSQLCSGKRKHASGWSISS